MPMLYKQHENWRDVSRAVRSTRLYRLWALLWTRFRAMLPSSIRRRMMYALDEVGDYIYEFFNVACGCLGIWLSRSHFHKRKSLRANFEYLLTDPEFKEDLEGKIPRLLGWYRLFTGIYRTVSSYTYIDEKSQSIFDYSPDEAVKIFRAKPIQAPPSQLRSHDRRSIQIQLFTDFEKGRYKYKPEDESDPDAWFDLPVDPAEGIDLSRVRKAWGFETVAFITNKAPLRLVFEPADENRLSPLALHDLSKGYTQPLRIFEPRTSSWTKKVRTARRMFFPYVFFMFTLLTLSVGRPEKDTLAMRAFFGEKYARAYQSTGKVTSCIASKLSYGAQSVRTSFYPSLLFGLALIKLPFGFPEQDTTSMRLLIGRRYTVVYQSAGNAALRNRLWATLALRWFLTVVCMILLTPIAIVYASACVVKDLAIRTYWTTFTAARDVTLFVSSLEASSWIIILGLCWFGLAEYFANRT